MVSARSRKARSIGLDWPDAKPENYNSRAIPLATFRDHVAQQIEEHNERSGRRSAAAAGRSFLKTHQASLAEPTTIIRWPSQAQKSLWLLAADRIRAQKGSGEIQMFGNRYWAPALNGHAGEYVTVRFDPERLQEPVQVYTGDDRLICSADCIAATGFDDAEAARAHARDRGAYVRAQREQLRLQRKFSADELARIYGENVPAAPAMPMPPKVKRLATGARLAPQAQPIEFEEAFSKGLRTAFGEDAEVIPFTPKSAASG